MSDVRRYQTMTRRELVAELAQAQGVRTGAQPVTPTPLTPESEALLASMPMVWGDDHHIDLAASALRQKTWHVALAAIERAAADRAVAELSRDTIADALMDARADWSWNRPPSTLTYQDSMLRLADVIIAALASPRGGGVT